MTATRRADFRIIFGWLIACIYCLISPLLFAAEQPAKLTLAQAAAGLGAEIFWDPLAGSGVFMKNGHLVSFRTGQELVLFDYTDAAFLDAPSAAGGIVYLTPAFVSRLDGFFDTLPPPVSYRVGAILIDPGHGGKDPGSSGWTTVNGKSVEVREKDVALAVSKDVFALLKAAYPDKKILLTRTGDTYPSLEDRVEMANSVVLDDHEAIMYISIHANSAFDKKATGFEVWYLTPDYRRTVIDKTANTKNDAILPILNSMMEEEFTTESILIAKNVMDGLGAQIGTQSRNRGMKEEAWFVVRNARMPSVLVELGFVSNVEEARLLADPAYLKKCAAGIYNGMSAFIAHFEGSRGFTAE